MIYTLTTNPSIDYYIFSSKDLQEGINRPEGYQFVAAGKGVNVSRVLANLNQKSKCVIVAGGFTGQYICDEINKIEDIEVIHVPIEGNSRVNVKIRPNGKEVDLNTSGPELTEENKKQLLSVFDEVKENDYVCFNGSLQKGMKETMISLAKAIRAKGGKVVLDVPNLNAEEIVECCPFMIKPNIEELQDLLQSDLPYPEIISLAKERLTSKGINIMLSLGKDGSCFIGKEEVFEVNCPKVQAVNTVGAGDSLLAGFMYMLENNKPLQQCLSFASATGSAAVTTNDLPTKEIILPLLEQVRVEKR